MNVMGELISLVGLAAVAGIIIGWCSKSFFSGGDKKTRQIIARDVDDAVADAKHLRRTLDTKNDELRDAKQQLQRLRSNETTTESGTRAQVTEINDLKNQLAIAQKTLQANQAEFSTFRTNNKAEQTELKRELSKYTAGGSASPERLNEANETIAALRSAVRENDKVIDSLRARVTEADTTVENLRTQLKTAESGRNNVESVTLEYDGKLEALTKELQDTTGTVEKQKRDYDLMLENKNADIKNLHSKLNEATSSSSDLQNREQDFKKQLEQFKQTENKFSAEVVDLKRVIADRDQALSKARQQTIELNSQLKSASDSGETEIHRLRAQIKDTEDAGAKIKSKSAEVAALNDMLKDSANKREALKKDLNDLNSRLKEKDSSLNEKESILTKKDTRIAALREELDQVVESRNKVSLQLGEIQEQGNIALEKLQQDLNNLAQTRDDYKTRVEGLQTQVSDITQSKDSQLRELRSQMTTASQSAENKLKDSNVSLTNEKNRLQTDIKAMQTTLEQQTRTIEQNKSDIGKQIEVNQRLSGKLKENEDKLGEFRSKLVREESESQRLNRELSDTEALRLKITERDAELRKLKIELQEANTSGPLQNSIDEHKRKNESLMDALRERDEELARLNTQMTNNRLANKQQLSSITLLTQEKEDQTTLIKSLEVQAENTLELHTKIARQSTELEELKARLYERDSRATSVTSSHTTTGNGLLQQVETSHVGNTGSKPRVFVRADSDTEALTGATGYITTQRPQFTQDGHRVRRADGSDDLTLLPGITQAIAGALSRHGAADFEQIALWTDREVTHYAERVGVSVQRAQQYNWPKAARNILDGSYRKDGQEIGNS